MKAPRTVLIGLGFAVLLAGQQPQRRPAQPASGSTAAIAPQETAPVRPEDRGGVSGTISNAATGELLRKANVLLRRSDARGGGGMGGFGGGPGGAGMYAATSDASGAYSITGVDPGTYVLTVQRGGFVDQRYGAKGPGLAGSTITLGKSQYLRDISVAMTPHGVIAGKVVDEDGDAVANANIQVLKRTYVRGRKQLIPADNASTNDLGEYRLFGLPPGRYYVSAAYRRNVRASGSQDAAQETYASTFYPGAPTPEMAAPVQVAAGSQLTGIDIRLRKTHIVRVTGRVVGGGAAADGRGRGGVTVTLMPKETAGTAWMPNQARPYNAQGDFVLYNVTPGSYFLTARSMDSGKLMAARMPLEVGSAPVENLSLQLTGGVDLTGRVKVEGSDTVTGNVRVSLTLRQGITMGGGPAPQPGALKDDGSFVVSGVQPDVYDVRVSGVPDGGYVRSVLFGNAEVLDTGLDFTNGVIPGDLSVSIRMAAAQVEGTVQNEKGEPAASAVVVLVPQGSRREGDRYYMTTSADATGHYTLKNITPGEYRVYAFDNVENSAYMDPEWIQPYEGRGESVSLRDNGRETVGLRLVVVGGA